MNKTKQSKENPLVGLRIITRLLCLNIKMLVFKDSEK